MRSAPILSSPIFLYSPTASTQTPLYQYHSSTSQCLPHRHSSRTAHGSPNRQPVFARALKHFSSTARPTLYHTLGVPPLAALATTSCCVPTTVAWPVLRASAGIGVQLNVHIAGAGPASLRPVNRRAIPRLPRPRTQSSVGSRDAGHREHPVWWLTPRGAFGTQGGVLKGPIHALAPDMDVLLQAPYGRPDLPLLNVQALHMFCLRATLAAEAAKAEERPSPRALWTRFPHGSALRCVVFPSGAD
ncbi:hypothetical protein H4582DRAFT_2083678 [Lactarius indigo]|nr:hypothetical protein H4582DRAFT_2083678 [Lactarius indigo]